jgi:hypothetical protein
MVASVGLGPYLRFLEVPEEAIDFMDIEASEFRRLMVYDCFEYMSDLSKESSGGISERIGCVIIAALLFSSPPDTLVAIFSLSRGLVDNMLSILKDNALRPVLVGFADRADPDGDERK